MAITPQYDKMLRELGEGTALTDLENVILRALIDAAPGHINRGGLSAITGHGDRKNRLAIAALRERGYPIVSNSGEAGYCLRPDRDTIEATAAELRSRAARLNERAAALERAAIRQEVRPQQVAQPAHQLPMFGRGR